MKIEDKINTILAYREVNYPDNIKLKLLSENLVDNEKQVRIKKRGPKINSGNKDKINERQNERTNLKRSKIYIKSEKKMER